MEDILEVYRRPYDPLFPVVCMDESTKQLLDEIRLPLPGRPGTPELYDCEYRRNGVATLFLAFEPLAGWRQVEVTEQRTRRDWAHFIRNLLDERYPHSKRVILVMDNLNTHSGASLYETLRLPRPSASESARDPLHAEAWKLAQHGRGRI